MKVIDLLNKIANEEEVPKKIKFDYQEYEYNDLAKTYYCGMNTLLSNYKFVILNDEVEILEEEKKIPEKFDNYEINSELYTSIKCEQLRQYFEMLCESYNQLLDYLKSKGE